MNTKNLVKGTTVRFLYYKNKELWYSVLGKDFDFPVPISDTQEGVFLAEDKGMTFMRYIRKHIDFLESSKEA